MKKALLILAASVAICSCSSFKSSGTGAAYYSPNAKINVANNWELVPGDSPITYTIDISTAEGRQKLNGLTLDEAKELAVNEAAQKYGFATFVGRPIFTQLKKGKRKILRITVTGLPAYYKNAGYFQKQTQHSNNGGGNINVHIEQNK